MIHILAGDIRQAHTLGRTVLHLDARHYTVVSDERDLIRYNGASGGTLLRWGTWHERPDSYELSTIARARGMTILDVSDQR